MIERSQLEQAIALGRAQPLRYEGFSYVRLLEPVRGYPRGSAVLPDKSVVPGYPSIGRIQSLEAGLPRQFRERFWAEEKIDGFNVRILRYEDTLYAFSRGGFVCPFSVDRVPEFLDPAVFDAEPGLILCAEIAGPDTPYLEGSTPRVAQDVSLFVFDMMRLGLPGFLAQADKFTLLEKYALPAAPVHGQFGADDTEALGRLILRLDAEGAEGLVLKTDDGRERAKYVTGGSCVGDIGVCAEQLLDLPPQYFTNRLTRLAIFLAEHPQSDSDAAARALGRAFLEGLGDAVAQSRGQGRVSHRYRCRFRSEHNARRFIQHLEATGGRHVRIGAAMPRVEGDFWVLEFERLFDHMTGTLSSALAGDRQYD
ncbi:RNA ligase [Methylonatrum kenyense]|uniref:RNA ligase n=1 Tax=Methylonatrum kenyense TaxID=455253 RepID=UPI0020BE2836|nr:RNA ligase [Methylonatrum kenyense]MCK8514964.1 RNA ligase [Methylonatrum kenyense]